MEEWILDKDILISILEAALGSTLPGGSEVSLIPSSAGLSEEIGIRVKTDTKRSGFIKRTTNDYTLNVSRAIAYLNSRGESIPAEAKLRPVRVREGGLGEIGVLIGVDP